MAVNQKFDFDRANQLKSTLTNGAGKLETDLKTMMQQVEGVREWWSGGSEQAFIENFRRTKLNIEKSLNQCIQEYNRLIGEIAQAKQQSDADIARQLNR
jgi:uncharacterized protein YukE